MHPSWSYSLRVLCVTCGLFALTGADFVSAADFEVGMSKLDISPTEPVRLSGYGNRNTDFERIDERIYVRAAALRETGKPIHVLVSVEGIGLAGVVTKRIAEAVNQQYEISRERLAVANTHSHTAPHTSDGIPNLFADVMSKKEVAAMDRYTAFVEKQVLQSVGEAIKNLAPAKISWGEGASRVAMNRRIIRGGVCVGMGPNPDGIIDETLPVLKITTPEGKLRGILFNYACHCTTLVPKHNFVNGDWAGYAQSYLEEEHPEVIALCTIGCGADANPEPRGEYEHAQKNGRTIANEVNRVLTEENLEEISSAPVASYGYAGLEYNRRDVDEFRKLMNDSNSQVRQHATKMVEVYDRKRRLPETYPMPIQTWSFGEELTMVFLGGEVVSPYAHRIKQELTDSKHTWVTAYANDVFGYVASEEMIQQGGYEVDFSQVFYNHPGPWASGTEDLVVKRVKELKANPASEGALSPELATKSWKLPEGYDIELVAAEPLIADPVNFSFGPDGRLWVVQMSDYPRGLKDQGIPGGQVRVLEDTNGDGKMDQYTIFLDGLAYPSGVMPWKKGAIVSCAPEIFYAEDTDGDGKADVRELLYSGFVESNPQHRVNGFAHGLDNWIHVGSGAPSTLIKSAKTGEVIDMSGLDIRIRPDSGEIETESGRTQYGRIRDDWGNWFGSENSYPMFHYVISDRYLRRNKFFPAPTPKQHLIQPAVAPPVFPASRTVDRFNDLFAANRFTSACGENVFRDTTLGEDFTHSGLICEPVHNLISRTVMFDEGATFVGKRAPGEQDREFLGSTDVWARPVRVQTGPDGALWFADMYRHVIEHPQWIPDDWQKMLNVRAGEDKGRIYRVFRTDHAPKGPLPNLEQMTSVQVATNLNSTNGTVRDLAQQLLVDREADKPNEETEKAEVIRSLVQIALHGSLPVSRLQALHTLEGINSLSADVLAAALKDPNWHVKRSATVLSEPMLNEHPELGTQIAKLVTAKEDKLKLQVALTLGEWKASEAATALGQLGVENVKEPWIRAAVLSSALDHADAMIEYVLAHPDSSSEWAELVQHLVVTALGSESEDVATRVLASVVALEKQDSQFETWQFSAMGSFLDALERTNLSLSELHEKTKSQTALWDKTHSLFDLALEITTDDEAEVINREFAIRLLSRGLKDKKDHLEELSELLAPSVESRLQNAAVENLARSKDSEVGTMLLEYWRSFSPSLQSQVVGVLLSRPEWTRVLLDAIEDGTVAAVDLDAATRSRLTSLPTEEFRERARKLLAETESSDRAKILEEYKVVHDLNGNGIRGSLVFRRACSACHQVREIGKNIGPNLAALSDKSPANVMLAVLDPNKAVEGQYRAYIAVMSDGRSHNGMIVSESSSSVTLAETSGEKRTILRADIDELINTRKSFMPEGLEKDLTPQDLADVVAFLQSRAATTAASDERVANKAKQEFLEATGNQTGSISPGPHHSISNDLSWLGTNNIGTALAGSSNPSVTYQTAAVADDADTSKPVTFLIPVSMQASERESAPFVLEVAETGRLKISATAKDAAWQDSDNGLTARYMAMETNGTHSSGVLELIVPAKLVTPGKPVELKLTAPVDPHSTGWIGIIPVK